MRINIIAADQYSEQLFIDGCIQAIEQCNFNYCHVLANVRATEIYFITEDQCMYDTTVNWNNELLEIMCIFNKATIKHFSSQLDLNVITIEKIRTKIAAFVWSMKNISNKTAQW